MKHLLQHFKTLTKHPKNASALKGLILQLAVRGKLTENWRQENPNVEPASKLLERIKEKKKVLIAEKKIKKDKELTPIEDHNKLYDLPENWVWCRLVDFTSLINGDRGKNYPSKAHYIDEGIPFITARNLGERFLNHESLNFISEERFNLLRSGQIQLNDILYCLRGSLGKCSIVEGIDRGAIASSLVIIRIINYVEHTYLLNYFMSPLGDRMIYKYDNGTAQPNLSATDVKSYLVPLPPLEEQKAIVAIVNELFKEVEQLEEQTKTRIQLKDDFVTSALQRLTETDNVNQEWQLLQTYFTEFFTEKSTIKQLRETILQLAVQGKLTAKWRTCHPELVQGSNHASELLKRIQTEKQELIAQKKIKKEKPLPPIEEHEKPYDLPEEWVWCRMGEIFVIGSSKRVFKADYVKEGVPFFRSKEIGQLGRGEEVSTELFISREKFNHLKNNFGVSKPGDVLIACIGGSIGNTWLVDDREFYYKDGNLVQIGSVIDINTVYLLNYLNSTIFYDSALGKVSGSAYNALTIEKIKNSAFPLPPLEEQKAIVEQVNRLMALCDNLEEHIENSQTQVAQLMQSCLRVVFEE